MKKCLRFTLSRELQCSNRAGPLNFRSARVNHGNCCTLKGHLNFKIVEITIFANKTLYTFAVYN